MVAGSVVTKSLPPYCIAGGVLAKVIKFRWMIDEILEHETILYNDHNRIPENELRNIMSNYRIVEMAKGNVRFVDE